MVRFVQQRQAERGDVGQHRLEFSVLAREALQPVRENRPGASRPGAADDDVQLVFQGGLLRLAVSVGNCH
ncbi:hypothetical protein [Mesorhizobium sp.]|uniref:hypothetical protein n=1 Tax=Mesorhizobium sp. TaxID=1871066 RepID=UPI0025E3821D|nr:hypothetical protein [Mesorhizobium sp.]